MNSNNKLVHIELDDWNEITDKGSKMLLDLAENWKKDQGFIGFSFSCVSYDMAIYYLITVPEQWLVDNGMESAIEENCSDTDYHFFSLDMYPKYDPESNSCVNFFYKDEDIKYMGKREWKETLERKKNDERRGTEAVI